MMLMLLMVNQPLRITWGAKHRRGAQGEEEEVEGSRWDRKRRKRPQNPPGAAQRASTGRIPVI